MSLRGLGPRFTRSPGLVLSKCLVRSLLSSRSGLRHFFIYFLPVCIFASSSHSVFIHSPHTGFRVSRVLWQRVAASDLWLLSGYQNVTWLIMYIFIIGYRFRYNHQASARRFRWPGQALHRLVIEKFKANHYVRPRPRIRPEVRQGQAW